MGGVQHLHFQPARSYLSLPTSNPPRIKIEWLVQEDSKWRGALPLDGGGGCVLVAELRIICRVLPLTALRLVSVYAIFLCFRWLGR